MPVGKVPNGGASKETVKHSRGIRYSFRSLVAQAKQRSSLGALSAATLLASCSPEPETQPMVNPSQDRPGQPVQTSETSSNHDGSEGKSVSRSDKGAIHNHSKRLLKADLERTVVGARFRPREKNSLASILIFQDSNTVIYAFYSAGPVYAKRYYKIEASEVCVYEDEKFSHLFECISFRLMDRDLFRLAFSGNNHEDAGVDYVREAINEEGGE